MIFRSVFSVLILLSASAVFSQTRPALVVDAGSTTGEIRHGATGWLYGQSQPGIPPVHMMNLLKPHVAAQKPAGGLQHPGGDAMALTPGFKAAGGQMMQIYIQDIYPNWPYNDNGLDDYLKKVDTVARQVVADPNRASFVYVPFNEPDNNWYGYSGPKFDRFLRNWLAVYREIRSIDSTAKIAGPNYEHLKPATYEAFFKFARDNHALPDETTWHELHDDFFLDWYQRYDGYRAMEKRLGIGPIPVVINEYTRKEGDLSVPGNLVQWITRLENSKVEGCLAFWTPAGTMSDLTARIWPDRATGAWWVYYWYAEMGGQTLKVMPPNLDAFGLQGIATTDSSKRQLRVLFGGTGEGVDLTVKNLTGISYLRGSAHVALWRVDSSGIQPSPGPQLVSQSEMPIVNGQVHLTLDSTGATSAYYVVLTPSSKESSAHEVEGYPAIYATLSGAAQPVYRVGDGTVRGVGGSMPSGATFPVTAEADGYYTIALRYIPHGHEHSAGSLGFEVNGVDAGDFKLQGPRSGQPWAEAHALVFLAGGVNSLTFGSLPETRGSVELLSLQLSPASLTATTYSATEERNTLSGGAVAERGDVGHSWIGLPAGASPAALQFDHISVPTAGKYKLIVTYSNDERAHGGTVDEAANIVVDGSSPIKRYFRQTFDAMVFCTTVIDIDLRAGENTIQIAAEPGHRGPTISQIGIAMARVE
jgi:hypothetical protein